MSPEIITEKLEGGDLVQKFVYTVTCNEVQDLKKIYDIKNFFNKVFDIYSVFLETHTILDTETGLRKPKTADISDEFAVLVEENGLKMAYNSEEGFSCEMKKTIDITDSDDSDESEEEDVTEEEVEGEETDGVDMDEDFDEDDIWGAGDDDDIWGMGDGEADEMEEEEVDSPVDIAAKIEYQFPQNHGDFKDADDWADKYSGDEVLLSYDEVGSKRDKRMGQPAVLGKLYKRDPTLFKWARVSFEPFTVYVNPQTGIQLF